MKNKDLSYKVPHQERSKIIFDSIIEASFKSFAELGFEATTTNKIAATAGISIGSFYRYFPNKVSLLKYLTKNFTDTNRKIFLDKFQEGRTLPIGQNIEQMITCSSEHFLNKAGFLTVLIMKMFEVGVADEVYKARRHIARELAVLAIEYYPNEILVSKETLEDGLYYAVHGYISVLLVLIQAGQSQEQLGLIKNNMRDLFLAVCK